MTGGCTTAVPIAASSGRSTSGKNATASAPSSSWPELRCPSSYINECLDAAGTAQVSEHLLAHCAGRLQIVMVDIESSDGAAANRDTERRPRARCHFAERANYFATVTQSWSGLDGQTIIHPR